MPESATPQAADATRRSATTTTNPRVLAEPVKVKLSKGERILRSNRGPQTHLVADGETLTVCDIDSAGWTEAEDVSKAREVTCPICAKRIAAGQRVSGRALREAQKAEEAAATEAEATVEAGSDDETAGGEAATEAEADAEKEPSDETT